ncbi:MAG: NB-ARC domain-containing protein [Mycobacteriales bacterium]
MSVPRAAVGRLTAPDGSGRLLGTAFAVDDCTVLTAFHCVGNRATGEVRLPNAVLDLDGARLGCSYLAGDSVSDCAALHLDQPLPPTARPLSLAEQVTAGFWRATGFPASLAELGSVTVSGTISNLEGQLRGVPAIQLYAEQSAAGLALGGLSGAPVFAGGAPGVIGLIRYNPPDPDSAGRGVGGIVYACPVTALLAVLESAGVSPVLDQSQARIPGQVIGVAATSYAAVPPDRLEFTGRLEQIEILVTALSRHDAATVIAVHGQGGIGKSALAVHVAHLVAAQFPDGRFYLDLLGVDQRPMSPADALERLLLAMGLPPDSVAGTEAERAGQYRELLATRRAVIVLDNARSAAQVRPLLPGTPGCAVLVTSRQPMSALDDAMLMSLGTLSADEAASLLIAMLNDDPRAQDKDGVAAVARLCDHLPLAIRIAAAQLRSRPHWTVGHLVSRLSDERRRLSILEVDDLAVRSSFDSSYVGLPQPAAEAFAALGGIPGPDFPAWTLAALLEIDQLDAEDLLDDLVDAQLVTFSRRDVIGATRYRCHDLIRVYAAEKALDRFDDAERRAGQERLLSGYLTLLLAATSGPGMDLFLAESVPIVWRPPEEVTAATRAAGRIEWFTDERVGLVAAARQAYEDGLWSYTWGIIDALNGLFVAQRHGTESLELKDLALKAASAARDPVAEAGVLYSYTSYYLTTGAHDKAVDVLRKAQARYRALGMRDREVRTLVSLGVVERDRGRLSVADSINQECLDYYRDGDDDLFFAAIQHNQSIVLREQGRLAETDQILAQCLPVFHAHDDTGVGRILHTRAVLNRYLGRIAAAEADLDEARPYCVAAGNVRWTGIVDLSKVRLLGDAHRWAELLARLPECERLFDDSEDNLGRAQVWRTRGAALRAQGDLAGALSQYAEAAAVYDGTDDVRMKARLTYGSALTRLAGGDLPAAVDGFRAAEQVFVDIDDQCWLLRTRHRLATTVSASDGPAAARPAWTEVGRLGQALIERAGPEYFPAWLRPILAAARAGGG